jgi:ribosomal protein L1
MALLRPLRALQPLSRGCALSHFRSFSAEAQPAVQITASASTSSASSKPRHTKEKKNYGVINIHRAIKEVKAASWAKFDETVEVSVNTGLDPRKPNQSVKGVVRLPNGTGKKTRICVIAGGTDIQAALDAGADVAGVDEVLAMIQAGDVNFNTVIATPEYMPAVSKLGRVSNPYFLNE